MVDLYHPSRKPETTALRLRVVAEWNKGRLSQAQIGAKMGITRGVVGRLLTEAREMGIYVLTIEYQAIYRRKSAGIRAKADADPDFKQAMIDRALYAGQFRRSKKTPAL